jgi:hypothetical protein
MAADFMRERIVGGSIARACGLALLLLVTAACGSSGDNTNKDFAPRPSETTASSAAGASACSENVTRFAAAYAKQGQLGGEVDEILHATLQTCTRSEWIEAVGRTSTPATAQNMIGVACQAWPTVKACTD